MAFCSECRFELEAKFKFCPLCSNPNVLLETDVETNGNDAVSEGMQKKSVEAKKSRRLAWVPILSFIALVTLPFTSAGLASIPSFLNLASGLKPNDVKLELQLGKNTSAWARSDVSVRAKVKFPHDLMDTADVSLEIKNSNENEWELIAKQSVRKSGVYVFTFQTPESNISQLRITALSGERLIQTSRPKEMRNYKTPNNGTSAGDGIYFRYFTDDEYDTISTPGCGTQCYAIWVAAPKNTFTQVSIKDGTKTLSKAVSVILNEPGKYKKVVIPTTGEGSVFFSDTRAASSAEISKASTPPRNNLDEAPYNGDYNSALDEKCQTEVGHSGRNYQDVVRNNYEVLLGRLEKLAASSSSWSFLSISEQRKREGEYDSLKQEVRHYADEYKLCSEKYPYGFFTQFLDKY